MKVNTNIHTFIACDHSYEESKIVIFGAPMDSTTSYRPGTRFASSAIRNESVGIETYSPRQDKDLLDILVCDVGDLELPFGNPRRSIEQIKEFTVSILSDGKVPFMIGGEHLVTLGAVEAAYNCYKDLHIIHFDAHADLREEYLGETLSHACVLRRCHDIVGDGKIFQFGIRSGDREEFRWGKSHVTTHLFDFQGLEEVVDRLRGKPVYFTLDLDVLDPSELPGTGTPEAGGVCYKDLVQAIHQISQLNIVGWDMNELSPVYDPSGASTALSCKLVRELLLELY